MTLNNYNLKYHEMTMTKFKKITFLHWFTTEAVQTAESDNSDIIHR